MNKEEIIKNAVKRCCICGNKFNGFFITINDKKYHLCCIEHLKDNWNELKKIVKSQSDFKLKCHNESLWFEVDDLLNKIEELEKGEEV